MIFSGRIFLVLFGRALHAYIYVTLDYGSRLKGLLWIMQRNQERIMAQCTGNGVRIKIAQYPASHLASLLNRLTPLSRRKRLPYDRDGLYPFTGFVAKRGDNLRPDRAEEPPECVRLLLLFGKICPAGNLFEKSLGLARSVDVLHDQQ